MKISRCENYRPLLQNGIDMSNLLLPQFLLTMSVPQQLVTVGSCRGKITCGQRSQTSPFSPHFDPMCSFALACSYHLRNFVLNLVLLLLYSALFLYSLCSSRPRCLQNFTPGQLHHSFNIITPRLRHTYTALTLN